MLFQPLWLEDEQAVIQLAEALTQGPAYDIRAQNRGPVFRQGFTKIEDLRSGEVFTGMKYNLILEFLFFLLTVKNIIRFGSECDNIWCLC